MLSGSTGTVLCGWDVAEEENLLAKQVLHHPKFVQLHLVSPNVDSCTVLG